MKYILNSAVITTPGKYRYILITPQLAREWLERGGWESTIGYMETCEALATLTGIPIPLNRKQIRMQAGDEALVFRLTCRLDDPSLKGRVTKEFIEANCEIGLLKKTQDF